VVRFKNNKARRIVEARDRFIGAREKGLRELLLDAGRTGETGGEAGDRSASGGAGTGPVRAMREWLAGNVLGFGYKEASHFLRNVGFCGAPPDANRPREVAILDRHVLKNLHALGLIGPVPESLSPKRYLEIEEVMNGYAGKIGIPLAHLDFVLWYRETGDIFK
jgi:thermostable 8-oxoguanine DNA glycosylase